jgi:AcrR family transcriptional regulator
MRKDGRETRHNVIEKSLQIFSVKGYYNTSISDIMAATGLTKGGLYAHFDSKEALWNAAYDRAVEIWRGIVFKGVRKVSDPLGRIARTIENDLRDYCCGEVFGGRMLLLQQLVELSGQSPR